MKHVVTFKQKILKESQESQESQESEKNDNPDTSDFVDCLNSLKKVNYRINMRDVIIWFNENDIDYFNMNDLEMYIYYIEKNAGL